jgi:hypothetical protein
MKEREERGFQCGHILSWLATVDGEGQTTDVALFSTVTLK